MCLGCWVVGHGGSWDEAKEELPPAAPAHTHPLPLLPLRPIFCSTLEAVEAQQLGPEEEEEEELGIKAKEGKGGCSGVGGYRT